MLTNQLTLDQVQGIATAIDVSKRRLTERLDNLTERFLQMQRLVAAGQIAKGLEMIHGSGKSSPYSATVSVNGRSHSIQGKSLNECERQRAEVLKRYPDAKATRCEILGRACQCASCEHR